MGGGREGLWGERRPVNDSGGKGSEVVEDEEEEAEDGGSSVSVKYIGSPKMCRR